MEDFWRRDGLVICPELIPATAVIDANPGT